MNQVFFVCTPTLADLPFIETWWPINTSLRTGSLVASYVPVAESAFASARKTHTHTCNFTAFALFKKKQLQKINVSHKRLAIFSFGSY